MHSRGYLEDDRRKGLIRLSNALKSAISHQQNIFEGLDIRYFGPFDGHNVKELVRILKQLKGMSGPKLLHLHTVKGKGYEPAEKSATIWHAPGKFDVDTGERIVKDTTGQPPRFQDVFGETLPELAAKASVRPHTIIGKNLGLNDPANALYDDTPETGYYSHRRN